MKSNTFAVIAFGANLAFQGRAGADLVADAVKALESRGVKIERISRAWTTPAWPDPSDPPFTNAVALATAPTADPHSMMAVLLEVEAAFGRVRGKRNAPRTMDLDLIDFAGLVINGAGLELPHPRLAQRSFVLGPLAEIAPNWVDPRSQRTALELYQAVNTESRH
jgi:2-amino-4-hydroxy-6-hydroxymethyldihydropteridine diphosphokinase